MTLVRKKLPKSGWILLALLAVVLIALPILHFTGVWDQSFWGDIAISIAMAGTSSGWIAGAIFAGCGALGFGICYLLKDYVIGIEDKNNNLQITSSGNTYQPLGTTGGTAVNP
jgi:hypothetical protein